MIEFSLVHALTIIFFSAFLPGIIFSFGLLKKTEFSTIEKIFIGSAFGWVAQGLFPFVEFLFFGITFSHELALANTALLYLSGFAIFILSRLGGSKEAIDNIQKNKIFANFANITNQNFANLEQDFVSNPSKYLIPLCVILLFFINFFVRIQTLSPIYQEIDPYYYIDTAQQIINYGYNPLDDKTAWYPEAQVSHRTSPLLVYMEATWYSLYTSGGSYNNYILSLVANIYPPFAAAFAAFFIYFGLRAWYRSEYALLSSIVLSFIPIFIMKLTAGEAEVQPYAFFALAMFIGFFLWMLKKQDLKLAALAGFGYFTLSLGSSSEVVALTICMIFIPLHAITLFLMKKNFEIFAKVCGVFFIFPLIVAVMKSIFAQHVLITYPSGMIAIIAILSAFFLLQKFKLDSEMQFYALGTFVCIVILLLAFTPLNSLVKNIVMSGLQIASFNQPLDRTIAEQGTSGRIFEPSLGFLGKIFDDEPYKTFLAPIFAIPTYIANLVFGFFSTVLNTIFGVALDIEAKENSILMSLLFFLIVASISSVHRFIIKKEETPAWFFVALVFPIALVGLIKAKYIIYLGFVLATALAFIFGELEILILRALNLAQHGKEYLFYAFLLLGIVIAFMQITESHALHVITAGFETRFQDNPAMFQQKFASLCNELRLNGVNEAQIANICAAGKDALAFANKSMNNQYNSDLCFISLLKNPIEVFSNPQHPARVGAAIRCERVTPYWINSMEWIRNNTENNSRITSWWDYGHWENFFGQRNAVIRNEHASHKMIGEIAHDYIIGTPEELKEDMIHYGSKYALFDIELIMSGNSFGGKYGALNYLGCARDNKTNVNRLPGTSACEFEHLWSTIYIPNTTSSYQACSISYKQKGITVYTINSVETQNGIERELQPRYCLGFTVLATGQNVTAIYELNNRSTDGSLKLHKAFIREEISLYNNFRAFSLIYTKDPVWVINGSAVSGWEDRTSKFYDSNLYNAFMLENLPGFELVYKTNGGEVKIFKIKD
ncbi:MAG: hypothetical protein AB1391_03455 [Candidatus Micrarchaeota archaeon]